MNDYSEGMKSEDASPVLRKLTEDAARGGFSDAPPRERFYEDFALLVRRPLDGWAIGVRIDFTAESWSIAELVAIPAGPSQTLPPADTANMRSYIETAVDRARERRRVAVEQLAKLNLNADHIQQRFDTWRDKTAPRTNVEYAALAAKYAEQIRLGNTRATATLAEQVGMSPSVMAQRIKEARRRYLLTGGERGRASGELTSLGVLYADPQFPGMSKLRRAGMTQRGIADKYGINEGHVWAAIVAENYADDDGSLPEPEDSVPGQGVSLTVEDILRRPDGGEQ